MTLKSRLIQIALLLSTCLLVQATAQAQGIRKASCSISGCSGCGKKTCDLPKLGSAWPNPQDYNTTMSSEPEVGTIGFLCRGCRPMGVNDTPSYGTSVYTVTGATYNVTFDDWDVSMHQDVFNLPAGMSSDVNQWPDCECIRKLNGGINYYVPYYIPSQQSSGLDFSSLPTGETEVEVPVTSNDDGSDDDDGGLPTSGCTTCGASGSTVRGAIRISIGLGTDTLVLGAVPVNMSLDFSANLAGIHTFALANLSFGNVVGGNPTALTVGTRQVKNRAGQVVATLQVQTTAATAPATGLQTLIITVTPAAGSTQPVTTHKFEKVTSTGDFTGVGVKYTRTAGSSSEILQYYNSGVGTTGTAADGTLYGAFKTVDSNGDVQIWSAMSEAAAFTWNASQSKWTGDMMELLEFIPAAAGLQTVITERHYAKIGRQSTSQSAKVVTSETVTTKQGATVLDQKTTRRGYYEAYYKTGTVLDKRFGLERWQASTTGEWRLTVRGYMPDTATPTILETLQITPWLDGPSTTGAFSSQAAAEAFFTGLTAQATGGNPQIAGCQITRTHDNHYTSIYYSYVYPPLPWLQRDISLINGVVVGTAYEMNAPLFDNLYVMGEDSYMWPKSRTERWNGAGTQMTWNVGFSVYGSSLTANLDQTDVVTLSSTSTLAGGLTSTDSWRRIVTEVDSEFSTLPDYVQGAMFPLWSTTVTDSKGRTVSEISKFSEIGTAIQTINTTYTGDTGYTRSAGSVTLASQSDDVVANGQRTSSHTDEQGVTTTTLIDEATGEVISETRLGVTTSYSTVTAADKSTTQTVTQSAGGATRTMSVTVTDAQGHTVSSTDANGGVTTYSYANNDRTVTETLPGGGTRITDTYLDGQLKSITGTAVTPEYHSYTVNTGGNAAYEAGSITETVYYGSNNGSAWRKTTANFLGQTLREETPSPTGTGESVTVHTYNAKGQRVKTNSAGMADLIIAYDEWGRVSQQGYDMNADGALTVDSNDVLSTSGTDYVQAEGTVLERVVRQQYTQDGGSAVLETKTERKLLEGTSWQRSTQADGGVFTQFDVLAGSTRTVHAQQSVTGTQSQIQIYQNGLLMSETLPGMTQEVTYSYDDFGQIAQVVHPLNGTITSTYDTAGRLHTQSQAGGDTITYAYNSQGQVTSATHTNLSTTTYTYDVQGRVLTQGGTAGYALRYEYDAMGNLWKLHTYRGGAADDVTLWTYDAASGSLLSKTDAAGRSVGYTYDVAGRMLTRQWQRGVTTTYSYDGAGRQTGIGYSDGTAGVGITYDRANRCVGSTDAAGVHSFSYAAAAGGRLASWSVGGSGAWSGLSVGYGYTSGRRSSRSTSLGSSITLPTAGYTYDASSGRMSSVSASDFTATYRYNASTGWNDGITYSSGLSSTRTADALGRLDAITWSSGGATVSGHDYTVDAMSRRTAAQRQDGSAWSYGYNSHGEVTSAGKAGEPGKQFAFAYDGIGNRTSSSVSSVADSSILRTTSYSANTLNQYASITHPSPGWVVLRGSVNATAGVTVTIDGNPPTQHSGTLWNHEQSVDNSAGPVRREVTISASRPDGGRNNGTVTTQQKGALFIPPPNEVLTYDLDGNLTSDARWNYVWNGENRLVAQEEKPGVDVQPTSSAPVKRIRLEFAYDAPGRRIGKRTFIATGSGGFVLQQSLVQLYDGWNMIAEIDTTTSAQLLRSYEWGTDVSGTMDGAGGVGGLLIVRFHAISSLNSHLPPPGAHAPCYDGNGNITELVNLANGSLSAHYEYGTFGETISMDGGSVAETNPFRFSTKILDAETGLYNYGYRYYDVTNGRWPNRDPIGERGGVNLYGMVKNDPVNHWDYLGQSFTTFTQDPQKIPIREGTSAEKYDAFTNGKTYAVWDANYRIVKEGGILAAIGLNDTCSFEFKGNLSITITHKSGVPTDNVQPVFNNSITPRGETFETLEDHEHEHAVIYKGWWNQFVKEANPYEAKYCCDCAKMAQNLVEAMSTFYYQKARYENDQYDHGSYGFWDFVQPQSVSANNVDTARKKYTKALDIFRKAKCVKK